MYVKSSTLSGIFMVSLVLILSVTLAFSQTDVTRESDTRTTQTDPQTATSPVSINPEVDAAFTARIQQIRQEATDQVAQLQSEMETSDGTNIESYQKSIEEVKRNAQISILEVRRDQELARGNSELAAEFQKAVDMLKNPAPRQTPDPQTDQNRLNEQRSQNDNTQRTR